MSLTFGSVCTGVGGIDLALERAGLVCKWQCEIDARRRGILAKRWLGLKRYHDLEGLADDSTVPRVGAVVGGTPCQDISVAGPGVGLDGARSRLFFELIRLADYLAARWILWENVPNALSINDGQDFAVCLEGFTGNRPEVPADGWGTVGGCTGPLGWAVWRVLDGRWWGPPQRRRRLIVVAGRLGVPCAPEIPLEPHSLPRRPASSGDAGGSTPTPSAGGVGSGGIPSVCGTITQGIWNKGIHGSRAGHGFCIPVVDSIGTATGSRLTNGRDTDAAQAGHLIVSDLSQVTSKENRSNPRPGDPAPTITCKAQLVAVHANQDPISMEGAIGAISKSGQWAVLDPAALSVRRLMPVEVERCFGLPDHWTATTACGSPVKDTPRGEMLGDTVIVPMFEWIGRRILAAEARRQRRSA